MVYVAAFAASEYASTIGRVAKPFNPLLGETYEYARPDKGYRFLIEQVSHHPPIGAAYANAKSWDYYVSSYASKSLTVIVQNFVGILGRVPWRFCADLCPSTVCVHNTVLGQYV